MLIRVLCFLFLLILSCHANPLDHVVAHGHARKGRLYACPTNQCEIDTTTKMYFWIIKGKNFPGMFLRSRDGAITITTTYVKHQRMTPKLTKELKDELERRSEGKELQMLEAEFPNNQMKDITYTFLITNDFTTWIAADMICHRLIRLLEPFRRGTKLICSLDKSDLIIS